MFFQFEITGFEWILGIGLAFGLALIFTQLTYKSFSCFLVWLTIFDCFAVWGGLLPLWTVILCLILLIIIMYLEIKNKGGID